MTVRDSIEQSLKQALEVVETVPSELRAAAFPEILGAFLRETRGGLRKEEVVPLSDMPDASVAKDQGDRLIKIAYATYNLGLDGIDCTTAAIKTYVVQQLGTKIKGNGVPDVLTANTPKYFKRRKDGRGYTYELTEKGLQMLAEFGQAHA